MKRLAVALALLLTTLCSHTSATRTGDEDFGPVTNGTFYVFADKAVSVISDTTISGIKNITVDQSGYLLTSNGSVSGSNTTGRTWNDCTYLQNTSSGERYVFVNEGDQYQAANGTLYGYVTALNATSQSIIARIQVGARPVHIYSINQTASIWSHSDAQGSFFVIPTTNPSNLAVSTVVRSYVNTPAHGKLIINDYLYPLGYGTNVAEQYLEKFNLAQATNIGNFSYTKYLQDASQCVGTHTTVYSQINKHAYFECIGGGGVLEWNTVNDTFVGQHAITGALTGAPSNDKIFVGYQSGSNATVLQPGANGVPSTVFALMSVPYNPVYPAFWSSSTSPFTFQNATAYGIYFPLAQDTNLYNIAAAGVANITTLSYMTMPSDCDYNMGSLSTSSIAANSSMSGMTLVKASNGSYLTPNCGACAPGINSTDPSQFNGSLSGTGFYNMSGWSSGAANVTTQLISAGAVFPTLNLATGAGQCTFSTSTSRAIKRGGPFVAIVAEIPQASLYLVNGASGSTSWVGTYSNPQSVTYVPNTAVPGQS